MGEWERGGGRGDFLAIAHLFRNFTFCLLSYAATTCSNQFHYSTTHKGSQAGESLRSAGGHGKQSSASHPFSKSYISHLGGQQVLPMYSDPDSLTQRGSDVWADR